MSLRMYGTVSEILQSREQVACGNTLASDTNGPGSTPGGSLELDAGYHPFVGRWNV